MPDFYFLNKDLHRVTHIHTFRHQIIANSNIHRSHGYKSNLEDQVKTGIF